VLLSNNLNATGVTGQNIPPTGLYPGLKRSRLDYTLVYYGLGQFIPPQAILNPLDINKDTSTVFSNIPNNYLICQQVAEYSVLSGKLSEKAKLTESKS